MRYPDRGYFDLAIGDNPYATLSSHVQKSREVATLLEYACPLATVERDPDQGIRPLALFEHRSIGDEPFLISQLVRLACAKISTQTRCRYCLGRAEARTRGTETGVPSRSRCPVPAGRPRGESGLHRTFESLESERCPLPTLRFMACRSPSSSAAFHSTGLCPETTRSAGDPDELHGGRTAPVRPATRSPAILSTRSTAAPVTSDTLLVPACEGSFGRVALAPISLARPPRSPVSDSEPAWPLARPTCGDTEGDSHGDTDGPLFRSASLLSTI